MDILNKVKERKRKGNDIGVKMNNHSNKIMKSVLIGLVCGTVAYLFVYFRIDYDPFHRGLSRFDDNRDSVKFVIQYLLPIGIFIVMAVGSYYSKSE